MDDERKTVTVYCRVVNGVTLRLFHMGHDDGTGSGYHPIVSAGRDVFLRGPSARGAGVQQRADMSVVVANEVDADFWTQWHAVHMNDPLSRQGMIWADAQ